MFARLREAYVEGIDYFRAIVRWLHAIAAVVWVGGSIFYLFALRPSLAEANLAAARGPFEALISKHFRTLVDAAIITLILTGVIITFDRLQSAPITALYYTVLALKLLAALSMFLLARDLGTRLGRLGRRAAAPQAEPTLAEPSPAKQGWRRMLSPSRLILALGLIAFLLSALLVHIYESDVTGL
ncbi:MAG: hypothetical protein FJ039_03895 [Chloroflexi bacterium]|nr:hypothetical protein [Chloroflexota bacterium]